MSSTEKERFCIECHNWMPADATPRSRVCSDSCREARKRSISGTVEARHACLLRVLHREGCPQSDPLYRIEEYEKILADQRCVFCRGPMSPSGHGLDRIDNERGHRFENVLRQGPVCGNCNGIRGDILSVAHMFKLSPALIAIRQELEDEKQYESGEINSQELKRRKEMQASKENI